jgi:hypothetical protein
LKTYSEYLAAGVPLQLAVGGNVLYVQRSEAGQVLNIEFISGASKQSVERVGKGFKAAPAGGFDSIRITAGAAGNVDFVVTDGEIDVKFDDAATIIGNDDGQAIPIRTKQGQRLSVDIGGGNVEVTATNVGINNTDANPVPVAQKAGAVFTVERKAYAQIVNAAPVAVGQVATKVSDDATLKRLAIRNASDSAIVALGGAGVTLANAVIFLQPGDVFIETEAAGAAWYGIADGAGASVQIQGVK